MATSGKSPESDLTWRQVATAVAAAAGGAAWVSAVGSGVVALRLRQADLPIEPVVALMSAEHRFAIGAGILIAPLLAGFFGLLVDWSWVKHRHPQEPTGDKQQEDREQLERENKEAHHYRQAWAFGTVLLGAVLVYVVLRPPFETLAFEALAVAVVVPVAFWLLQTRRRRHSRFSRAACRLPGGARGRWRRRHIRGGLPLAVVRRNQDHAPRSSSADHRRIHHQHRALRGSFAPLRGDRGRAARSNPADQRRP